MRIGLPSLMSAACEIGALCGASEHRETLARYGEQLGMAFQITDDLIDYTEAGVPGGIPQWAIDAYDKAEFDDRGGA